MQIIARKELSMLRIKKGLSQNELAKLAKIHVSIISRSENGSAIRPATAYKICKALNTDFDILFKII